MSFLSQEQIHDVKEKITNDLSLLGKLNNVKKNDYMTQSVDYGMVDKWEKEGWEVFGELKTKAKIRKIKDHGKKFEDDIWCQLYNLGYRYLNQNDKFYLPYGKSPEEKKQIDVFAVGENTVLIIECKSAEEQKKGQGFKEEFELLSQRLDGFRKAITQIFGEGYRVKYIFATRNLRFDPEGVDIKTLKKTNSFHYNDNTYKYTSALINKYKGAARYQFMGLLFKNEIINIDKIEIPALKGKMGNKTYYMFSIEPHLLLKMGFVLHRVRANEDVLPTYQRLLVPSRLNGITKFIDKGGYFPNSLIINFNTTKNLKLEFESASKKKDSNSRFGTLKIPNAFAIAYIIDGQHRLYGYANSNYKVSNTVPVVAFIDLTPREQLEIFMDINENQKAVPSSLRITLAEDLYWESPIAQERMKALRSSIISSLGENSNNVLYGKITVGEDKGLLSQNPFNKVLTESGLLPLARGNKYKTDDTYCGLYDVHNHNHQKEMESSKSRIIQLINVCYEYVREQYPDVFNKEKSLILSNRGTYAYIGLIGSLNKHLTKNGELNSKSSSSERFESFRKYFKAFFEYITNIEKTEEDELKKSYGAGADKEWLNFFQSIINKKFKDFDPPELQEWREKQDEDLQDQGRKYGVAIEKQMKKIVLEKLKSLFGNNWDLEISAIKEACDKKVTQEETRQYRDTGQRPNLHWTEMFTVSDYKSIIGKFWDKKPSDESPDFKTFKDEFAIDIGIGANNKADLMKWISFFSGYRNLWAHEASKEKRLTKKEVDDLKLYYNHFFQAN